MSLCFTRESEGMGISDFICRRLKFTLDAISFATGDVEKNSFMLCCFVFITQYVRTLYILTYENVINFEEIAQFFVFLKAIFAYNGLSVKIAILLNVCTRYSCQKNKSNDLTLTVLKLNKKSTK